MKNNKEKTTTISRLSFLKNTGIVAAGLTFLPGLVSSKLRDSLLSSGLAAGNIIDYQIIIPSLVSSIENQAAQQLQKYLSKISIKPIPIAEEGKTVVTYGIYIGETEFAKANEINFNQLPEAGFITKTTGNNFIIVGGSKK